MRLSFLPILAVAVIFSILQAPSPAAEQEKSVGRFLGSTSTEYPVWFKESFLDFNDDIKEAAKEGKRVMLLFHQDGCPYCNLLVERNLSQKSITDYMKSHYETIAINLWGDRELATIDGQHFSEKKFAEALRVQFTPTLIFLDENGDAILRLNGYLPPERFMLALQYASTATPKSGSFREFVRKRAPAKSRGELIKEDFFQAPPVDLSKLGGSRPIAVYFEQKQCPACETMHDNLLHDEETLKLVSGFHNIQLDMWSDTPITLSDGRKTTARKWAEELGIHYAPTILFLDAKGKEIIRSEAMFKTFHAQSIFDYVLSGTYKSEPNFQRYLEARADRIRKESRDVDIWK